MTWNVSNLIASESLTWRYQNTLKEVQRSAKEQTTSYPVCCKKRNWPVRWKWVLGDITAHLESFSGNLWPCWGSMPDISSPQLMIFTEPQLASLLAAWDKCCLCAHCTTISKQNSKQAGEERKVPELGPPWTSHQHKSCSFSINSCRVSSYKPSGMQARTLYGMYRTGKMSVDRFNILIFRVLYKRLSTMSLAGEEGLVPTLEFQKAPDG